jgi:hypothetical protein
VGGKRTGQRKYVLFFAALVGARLIAPQVEWWGKRLLDHARGLSVGAVASLGLDRLLSCLLMLLCSLIIACRAGNDMLHLLR